MSRRTWWPRIVAGLVAGLLILMLLAVAAQRDRPAEAPRARPRRGSFGEGPVVEPAEPGKQSAAPRLPAGGRRYPRRPGF